MFVYCDQLNEDNKILFKILQRVDSFISFWLHKTKDATSFLHITVLLEIFYSYQKIKREKTIDMNDMVYAECFDMLTVYSKV